MQPVRSAPTPLVRLATAAVIAAAGVLLVLAGALALGVPSGGSGQVTGASPSSSPSSSARSGSPSHESSPAAPTASSALPAGEPVLLGAGDIARCDADGDEATAALLAQLQGAVFVLGDTAYPSGTPEQLRDCYGPSWGRLTERTRFAAVGNHDYATDGAAPFDAYFGRAGVREGVHWFSEDVGTWHVVVLDANCGELDGGCGPDSAQLRWLRDDLAASDARCTLAMWHQPRFSSGYHGNDPDVGPFWDALYAAGADLVLNGHDHDYERFAPQDPAGTLDRERGVTEIVVGTGGGELRGFATLAPNSVVRSNLAYGVLELRLGRAGWGFRFVSTDGSFSDQGRGACH